MRAVSLPSFRPGQLIAAPHVLWYALLIGAALLAFVALLTAAVAQSQPAVEPQLLAPFRWMSAGARA